MVLYACSQAKINLAIAVLGIHFSGFSVSLFFDSGQITYICAYFRV